MAATKKYVSLEKLTKYDELLKAKMATDDKSTLDSAKAYADGLASNYESAGSVNSAKTELQGKIDAVETKTDTAQTAAEAAQSDVDALETYVGTIPTVEGETAPKDVIAYIDKKTSGIATSDALSKLQTQVNTNKTDIATINGDYLKAEDKTELSDAITAEQNRATGIEGGLRTDVDAIKADYLKAGDKTTLEASIVAAKKAGDDAQADIDAFMSAADVGEAAVDTLKEIQDYITNDGQAAATMTSNIKKNADAITALDTKVGAIPEGATATTIAGYIDEAVGKEETRAKGIEGGFETRIAAIEGKFGESEGTVESQIAAEATRVDGLLANKVDKVDGKGLSANDLTDAIKANYDAAYTHSQTAHAPADAQANIIESVKVNGNALKVADKAVDVTVPTKVSELTNDSNYLVAGDIANKADKATTLAGYGITDAYTTAQTDTAIANAIADFVECSEEDITNLFPQ